MLTLQSLFEVEGFRLISGLLAAVLPPTTAVLAVRLLVTRRRLAATRREVGDLSADRDRVLAELALTRERLVETRQAAGRAQADAADREARLRALASLHREAGERRTLNGGLWDTAR